MHHLAETQSLRDCVFQICPQGTCVPLFSFLPLQFWSFPPPPTVFVGAVRDPGSAAPQLDRGDIDVRMVELLSPLAHDRQRPQSGLAAADGLAAAGAHHGRVQLDKKDHSLISALLDLNKRAMALYTSVDRIFHL